MARVAKYAWKNWVRPQPTVPWVVGAIAALMSLAGTGYGFYIPISGWLASPPRMTGALNIAVAEFGVSGDSNSGSSRESGQGIARNIFKLLETELLQLNEAEGLGPLEFIQVWPPEMIDGSMSPERDLTSLAEKLNAHVVVFGDVAFSRGVTTLTPFFHLSGQKFEGAEELLGSHQFGPPIKSSGELDNISTRHNLMREMRPRVNALAQIIFGLDHYAAGSTTKAAAYFEDAVREADNWGEPGGTEVLYLYLGNARGKLGKKHLAKAREAFSDALNINPRYGRAMLGRAEIDFQDSRGYACRSGDERGDVDVKGLKNAIDGFLSAGDPSQSDLTSPFQQAKRSYFLGRTSWCLSIAESIEPSEALRYFGEVISGYRAVEGQELVLGRPWSNLAAEAHGLIAGIYESVPAERDDADLAAAAQGYQLAAELTYDQDKRATYLLNLASVFLRMNECGRAADAIAKADETLLIVDQDGDLRQRLERFELERQSAC